MLEADCDCVCHGGSSAFRPACPAPGGCGPHEAQERYCTKNCVKPLRRLGWPNSDPGRPCPRCTDVTESDLHAIISLDQRLQVEDPDGFALGWTTSDNLGVRANGREAPIPGNLEALNLRGPAAGEVVTERLVPVWRTRHVPAVIQPAVLSEDGTTEVEPAKILTPETWVREPVYDEGGQQLLAPDGDQHGAAPLPATVWRWVHDIREVLHLEGWPEDGSVGAAIRWLGIHYERALLALPMALDWADAVRATARSLRSILGDFEPLPTRVPGVACPREDCGVIALVRLPKESNDQAARVECGACGTRYLPDDERLQTAIEETAVAFS